MKSIKLFFVLAALQSAFIFGQTKQITADKSQSTITYKLTHPLHEIESTSRDANCVIDYDNTSKEIKKVDVQVDVTTFDSGNSNRDSHAMEVIDALDYPNANFSSTSLKQQGENLLVTGKLTFHGITKDITITGIARLLNNILVVSGNFDISLTEFKIERPSLLLVPVNDKLEFNLKQVFKL